MPLGWTVTAVELDEVRAALRGSGIRDADAGLGADGRVTLTGQYRDRAEVELAFSVARSIVGVRRLAPTTPERIKERLPGAAQSLADAIRRIPKESGPALPLDGGRARPPSKYAVIVGINSFTKASALVYAEKDAQDYHAFLTDPRGAGVPSANARLLVGRDATARAIRAALQEISSRAGPGDRVYAMFSTHGTGNAYGRFDLIATDTQFARGPNGSVHTERETVVGDEALIDFVSSLTRRGASVYLVLDTCYSGKAFAAIPGFLPVRSRDLFVAEEQYATGLSAKVMRDYVGSATPSSPVVMISASGENERSWDVSALRNGVFTHYFLLELKDKRDVRRAFDASSSTVAREAPRLVFEAKGERITQTPQIYAQPSGAPAPL